MRRLRSTPSFSLTGKVKVKVLREGQVVIVKGRPVKQEAELIEVDGNVQPLKFKEVMALPEVERTREWIKIYSADKLRSLEETEDGNQPDTILWNGFRYRVMKCHQYQMGVLDHYVAYAAKTTQGAGYEI